MLKTEAEYDASSDASLNRFRLYPPGLHVEIITWFAPEIGKQFGPWLMALFFLNKMAFMKQRKLYLWWHNGIVTKQ